MNIKTILIDNDETSKELLRAYLKSDEELDIIQEFKEAPDAIEYVEENGVQLVMIDISYKTEQALDFIYKITSKIKGIKVIALSYDVDSELVVKTLRAGARDFLIKPLIEKDLMAVIKKTKDAIEGNVDDSTKCKVISTFSNKGGLGKTLIATNIAVEIANLTKEKVALVDLNMQMGDVTTFLNLNPVFDTSYVIRNLNKIDEASILSSLEQYKDTSLYVLSDPSNLEQAQSITAEDITNLLNILKNVFSYVIIDTTSSFEEKTISALDNSDLILLVSTVNIPAVRNCQRCLDLFNSLEYPKDKIKLVINRYIENDEVNADDFEKALQHSIYFKIPNDYFTSITSVNRGVPISDISPDSNIAKSYKNLASILADNFTYEQQSLKTQKKNKNIMNMFKEKN